MFGPNRRPIVQFSVENRRALQLQEQRRERLKAKQELLKNPTNKTVSFESNRKKKEHSHVLEKTNINKVRLSDVIKQQQANEETNENDANGNSMEVENDTMHSNVENKKKKKQKRMKKKSKSEIRDDTDRMIAKSRNKTPLPQKTKKKWFE